MEKDSNGRIVVAMYSGLYEHYPSCKIEAIVEMLNPRGVEHIVVEHTKDGLGIGAAQLTAANSIYAAQSST